MNILIISYGSIAKKHFSILSAYSSIKNIDVISRYLLQNNFGKVYKKIEDVDLEIYDYIIICSPTYRHYEDLKYIEENTQNKLILVEKPIFKDNQRVDIQNNRVFVLYNLRFTSVIQKVKDIIKNEEVLSSDIYVGSYLPYWREGVEYSQRYSAQLDQGGGVLLDLSHEIDYARYLFGEFKEIKSISKKISSLEIDSDDICEILTSTNRCKVLSIHLDYLSFIPTREIIIHTKNFSLKVDMISGVIKYKNIDGDDNIFVFENDVHNSYIKMHESILKNEFNILASFEDAIETLKTIQRVRNYAKE